MRLRTWILLGCLAWPYPIYAEIPIDSIDYDVPVNPLPTEKYQFEILSTLGYSDQTGRTVVDIIEGYEINLALSVDTLGGRPVNGLTPKFDLTGSSKLIPPGKSTPLTSTDESGILRFGVIGGKQGMDTLTVSYGDNRATLHLNIISLQINDLPAAPIVLGGLNWSDLMQTRLSWADDQVQVNFSDAVKNRNGDLVTVSGFMMPMDSSLKQTHFLLTSSPPHCFFDIPGGPAGVIEVYTDEGIEASWDPIVLEGEFELISAPQTGVIYQLKHAKITNP